MKTKILFLTFILSFAWITQVSAQFKLGVEAGYLNNHYSIPAALTTKQQHGFLTGVIASYTINDIGWLESGLTFQQKGFEFEPSLHERLYYQIDDVKMKGYYFDLSLLMGLKFNLSNDLSIIPKMGGYLSYGLKSTINFKGKTEQGEAFSEEYDFFTELYNMGVVEHPKLLRYTNSRVDAGLKVGVDLMWKQYAVRGAYKFDLIEHSIFEHQTSGRSFSIAVAYYFLNK